LKIKSAIRQFWTLENLIYIYIRLDGVEVHTLISSQAGTSLQALQNPSQGKPRKILDPPKILQQGRVATGKPSLARCNASPLFFLLNKYNLGFISQQ
jgi:hypothetical protein